MKFITLLFLLGLSGLAFTLLADNHGESMQASGDKLETVLVEERAIPRLRTIDGTVEAINQTTVSAQTSGEIVEIHYDVNDRVTRGQLLLRLKDTEQRAALAAAEAKLREAQARYQEADAEYDRIRGLRRKQLSSESDLDRERAGRRAALAQLDAAKAGVTQAEEQLNYTEIRAPYSGIVTERYVQIGETARPGLPLMSGISLEQLRVVAEVPQRLIETVRRLSRARVLLDSGEQIDAEELTFFPFAHPVTNSFRVRVRLPAEVPALYPGMFAKVAFVTGEQRRLMIPASAVAYRSEVTGVYVVDEQGRVRFRHLRVGELQEEMIVVLAGLIAGERVALDPIAAGVMLKQQRHASVTTSGGHHE